MELRPYQIEARAAVLKEWEEGHGKTLLCLPTGTGKTCVFASVIEERQKQRGGKALILAHREELLTQAQDKLLQVTGLSSALEKAESSSLGSEAPVTVGSVQTLCRPSRLNAFPEDAFHTVVVDEAHHSLSDSYQTVLKHFASADVLGVTATPDRGDRRALGEYYDSLAYEYSMKQAIDDGYLCPIRAKMLPVEVALSDVRISGGDYSLNDVGNALEPYLENVARQMVQECLDRKTVVFLPLVRIAKRFCELLNSAGLSAREVNGESSDREEILQAFEAGEFQVLCNAMLLTEGWDCPSVDCVVVLRPTKVRSLYQQMVGRGTRLSPGKEDLLILDFLYLTEKHDLCTPASLLGGPEEVQEKVEMLLKTGEEWDLTEADEEAARDVLAEREAKLAERLEQERTRSARTVDPLAFALSIESEDLALYRPTFLWEYDPPTPRQLQYLEKRGISARSVSCKGQASMLIDKLMKRQHEGLSTPKQIRCLERYGFQHVGTWSFEKASSEIDRLARNGWRSYA